MNRRSRAAVKANRTRQARRSFRAAYPTTWQLARDILCGKTTNHIAFYYNVPTRTVAAVRANLSRPGTFRDMAEACNY